MFNIDLGNDGQSGPFLAWSARGTQDGSVGPQQFFIRDGSTKTPFDLTQGVVMDIEAMKTGWQKSEGMQGVAPEWKWNPSPSQMMPQPGDDYKKGLSVKCAIGQGQTAVWEQAGAAVWQALTNLAPQLAQQPQPGKLPVVRMTGADALQFKKGSTVVPRLEVAQWVDRPDCLKEGAAAGVDTGGNAAQPATPQAQQPAQAPQAPAAPAAPATSEALEF